MVVRDGATATAGAAFAHIDLALSLVPRISPRLASETELLIDQRHTPSVAAFTDHLHDQDRLVTLSVTQWLGHGTSCRRTQPSKESCILNWIAS